MAPINGENGLEKAFFCFELEYIWKELKRYLKFVQFQGLMQGFYLDGQNAEEHKANSID